MIQIVTGTYHDAMGRLSWGARLKSDPMVARYALTAYEAVGLLVIGNPDVFGVKIEQAAHGGILTDAATNTAHPSD